MRIEFTDEDTLIVRPSAGAATVIPLWTEDGFYEAMMVAWALVQEHPREAERIYKRVKEVEACRRVLAAREA